MYFTDLQFNPTALRKYLREIFSTALIFIHANHRRTILVRDLQIIVKLIPNQWFDLDLSFKELRKMARLEGCNRISHMALVLLYHYLYTCNYGELSLRKLR